ncbi:MAG: replication-associated recombination protein A [Bacilli bacterium]
MLEPLAFRMRPKTLDEVIGQEELVGEDGFLTNSVREKLPLSFILYGNPGTGKTTIAEAYAKSLKVHYILLNAVTCNKKDIENAIEEARIYKPTIVIIDEVHRLNKDKQDILLPYIEDGTIYLIGATTANPYISINKAIRSRCHLLEVKKLSIENIEFGLKKAITSKDGLDSKLDISDSSLQYIAKSSNGDFRFALNYLEILYITYKEKKVSLEDTKKILKVPNYQMDKNDDDHYNAVSALQKSIRGSDVDAALYYLSKLCIVNDLEDISRRLLVTAYEDIGLANPSACMRCKVAIDAANQVGLPEAIIPLSVTVCELALSPKSKVADLSVNRAYEVAKTMPLDVPDYLKLTPINTDEEDLYPYDRPDVWPKIQYLPEIIKKARFYIPEGNSKFESLLNENYKKLLEVTRSSNLRELKKK